MDNPIAVAGTIPYYVHQLHAFSPAHLDAAFLGTLKALLTVAEVVDESPAMSMTKIRNLMTARDQIARDGR